MYRNDTPHHNFSKMEALKKLKVADLKNELRARGLTVTGNKQELLDRLQQHMETAGGVHAVPRATLPPGLSLEEAELFSKDTSFASGEGDEADDSILAGEEEEEEEEEEEQTTTQDNQENTETTNTAKPTVVTSVSSADTKVPVKPPMSEAERLELRAKKFGGHASEVAKKAARAARFGTAVTGPTKTETAAPVKGATTLSPLEDNSAISSEEMGPEMEKLKKRAERFGMNVSTATQQAEEKEKLLKRKQRFGAVTAGAAGTQVSSDEVEAKKKKRAERFGLTV
ncbi:PREDICTED: SAP domain-containing ribonucleoprotein-like isoform X2 [Branchiostoma belcheri]|uniref:SAP domain-containing ribonucleoprotein-like isoform X2 n=1 Tax=Branchiostoma belcheri TaxID=7741 RepID=A0A6P5A8P2_BRABE|nr:PREDICTED: SAP domain-containing ribonucleoprotein-like isoform X2 [Branchiostoma belcheri]